MFLSCNSLEYSSEYRIVTSEITFCRASYSCLYCTGQLFDSENNNRSMMRNSEQCLHGAVAKRRKVPKKSLCKLPMVCKVHIEATYLTVCFLGLISLIMYCSDIYLPVAVEHFNYNVIVFCYRIFYQRSCRCCQ